MKEARQVDYFLIALLIFLPTCAYVPISAYLLFVPFLIYYYRKDLKTISLQTIKQRVDKNLIIIAAIVFLVFVNRIIHFDYNSEGIKGFYAYLYLLPLTYFIARIAFHQQVFKFFAYLVSLEVIVGILEFTSAQSSFFTELRTYYVFENYDYLYYTRVFGFGTNSPAFAMKIMVAYMLLDFIQLQRWLKISLHIILLIGIYITFNRSVFIVLNLYFVIRIGISFYQKFIQKRHIQVEIFLIPLLFFAFWYHNPLAFKNQFTRGNTGVSYHRIEDNEDNSEEIKQQLEDIGLGNVEMSGRREIWGAYLSFFKSHIVFGNSSKKLMIKKYHAHNSYLQLLASNGIIIAFLVLLLIPLNINKYNMLFIGIFLVLSLGQYFIFWGVSFADIFFYSVLFNLKKPFNEG